MQIARDTLYLAKKCQSNFSNGKSFSRYWFGIKICECVKKKNVRSKAYMSIYLKRKQIQKA